MAWPVVVGSLLAAGGAYASNRAARRRAQAVEENQRQAIEAQRLAQQQYDERRQSELDDALTESLIGVEDTRDAQAEREAALIEAMEANRPIDSSADTYSGDAGAQDGRGAAARVVEGDQQARAEREGERSEQRRHAMAQLQSLGDVFNQATLDRAPHQDRIQAEAGHARRRASRMPLEMDAAYEDGMDRAHGTEALGSIMSGIGTAMLSGGAGAAAGGGATGAAASGAAGAGSSLATQGAYGNTHRSDIRTGHRAGTSSNIRSAY